MTTGQSTFQTATAAFSRGDFAAARRGGEALLKQHPSNPSLLQFLGVVACQERKFESGVSYLRLAIANGGDTPDNRVNLAKALLELGSYDEAEALCSGPDADKSADLTRLRGDILKARGDTYAALRHYQDVVIAQPNDFAAWNNLGNARHESGDFDGALEALERALQLDPKSSLAHVNRARVFMSLERFVDACFALEQAALLAPKDSAPLLELGRTLISIDHSESALRALGTAARLDPRDPQIFRAIGLAFTDLGDLAQAERAYRVAIHVAPDHAPAYLDLGTQLEKENRVDELEALIAAAESASLAGNEIDYLRALLLSRRGEPDQALALARGIDSRAIHPAVHAQFLGQLADRLGRVDEALAFYEAMNRSAAESPLGVAVDRSAYQRDIERITAATTPEWFDNWVAAPRRPDDRPAPAFLVGFPRSGTTLLDTFLMGQGDAHILEEVPILEKVAQTIGDPIQIGAMTADAVIAARAEYFAELDRRAPPGPGQLVIDKNPLSMIRLPLIYRLFPEAKVILALRHPCDVVLSCFMQNFKVTEAMASFLDLDGAARAYDRIFTLFEKSRAIIPADVAEIRYEDMVADPERAIRPIVDFLGLRWDAALLDHQRTARERGHIRTPSYAQVTEPVYARASGRWTRYRDAMASALPLLAPWCERYGYSLE